MKFKWFIGIDISKKTLDVSFYDKEGFKNLNHIKVNNNVKSFVEIIKWFKKIGAKLDEVLVCMEHTGVYGVELAVYLDKMGITYSMVPPLHIKRSIGLSRGKNDKVDSFQISRFCYLHRDELKFNKCPSLAIQKLKGLFNERERLVKMQTVEKQVLKELKGANTSSTIQRIKARLKLFACDISLIEKEIKLSIEAELDICNNYNLIKSVIGIGMINAVLFIIYTNNFQGFKDARKFACYCGVAPFENSSGTSVRGKTRVSHLANKRIKTNLSNAARSAVQNDPELRLYYQKKEKEGKKHGVIMNAVKFKLITRVFAVINRGTPFIKMRQAG
jgi:transposase